MDICWRVVAAAVGRGGAVAAGGCGYDVPEAEAAEEVVAAAASTAEQDEGCWKCVGRVQLNKFPTDTMIFLLPILIK